jgi:hypothetical protein
MAEEINHEHILTLVTEAVSWKLTGNKIRTQSDIMDARAIRLFEMARKILEQDKSEAGAETLAVFLEAEKVISPEAARHREKMAAVNQPMDNKKWSKHD